MTVFKKKFEEFAKKNYFASDDMRAEMRECYEMVNNGLENCEKMIKEVI